MSAPRMPDSFYDQLGAGYNTIINWDARLRREAPFFGDLFERHGVESVLDTACGTGEHAWLFASWGLRVVGTDISEEMLAAARRKGPGPQFARAAFGETYDVLHETFGAVTCLGNSFPHVLTGDDARRTVADFARLARPGGVLVVQQLNYEAMRVRNERFLGPESRTVDGVETLFLRIFDLDRSPVRFTIVQMTRTGNGWSRDAFETEHRAWSAAEMRDLLTSAGFASIMLYGDFARSDFESSSSDQMIVVASRPTA